MTSSAPPPAASWCRAIRDLPGRGPDLGQHQQGAGLPRRHPCTHRLDDDAAWKRLLERLEDSELDDYTDIITLIGVEFDENTAWGQLTILGLKLLINLALQQFEGGQRIWSKPSCNTTKTPSSAACSTRR